MGMAYQESCFTEWLYQVHLSLYIHVYVYDMFMYSVSHSVWISIICCSTQTMLKVAYVSLALTASTITCATLVCGLIALELPIASPWALKEGAFTKKTLSFGQKPIAFLWQDFRQQWSPHGDILPLDGALRWHPCHAARTQHWGSTLLQTSQGPFPVSPYFSKITV